MSNSAVELRFFAHSFGIVLKVCNSIIFPEEESNENAVTDDVISLFVYPNFPSWEKAKCLGPLPGSTLANGKSFAVNFPLLESYL